MKKNKLKTISKLRTIYIIKLIFRGMLLISALYVWVYEKNLFNTLYDFDYFGKITIIHVFWIVWIFQIIVHFFPVKNYISIGSQKYFSSKYRRTQKNVDDTLIIYIKSITKIAYKILLFWICLIFTIGFLYYIKIFNAISLFMITALFRVLDLVCVLFWCPFRLIMKNRCCTTCRIFNWDHIMTFSPLIFIGSFFAYSLCILSLMEWIIWELSVLKHPERFYEKTNKALKCSECTDQLCNQSRKKLN